MPLQPKVKIDGKDVLDVLDVAYTIGSGWDNTTGDVRGEVEYGPVVVTKMMRGDSALFFKKAALTKTRFPVEIIFRWQDPATQQPEDYIWITLDKAVMLNYSIEHQDWKDGSVTGYNPVEILTLGYVKLKIKSKDGEHEVVFEPKPK